MPIVLDGRVKPDIPIRPVYPFTWRAASCVTILDLKIGKTIVSNDPGRVEGKTLDLWQRIFSGYTEFPFENFGRKRCPTWLSCHHLKLT